MRNGCHMIGHGQHENVLEVFTSDVSLGTEELVHEDKDRSDDGKEESKTKDDHIADSCRQRRSSSKEGLDTLVLVCQRGQGEVSGRHGELSNSKTDASNKAVAKL